MQDYIIVTDDMLDDSYLEHYGVVGMHWHHRKAVAAAAKGNYKKMQKHLDKNIANNKKKNGFYYKRLEKVSQKEVDKYKEKKKKHTGAKVALGLAAAAGVGYLAKKGIERRGEKKNAREMADRYNINNAINEVRRNNQPKARTLAEARAATQSKPKTEQRSTYVPPIQAVLHENDLRRSQSRTTSTNRTVSSSQRHASVSEAAEAVRRYQEAANRAASSLDNTRRSSRPKTQTSSNSHASVSDAAEALRRYQEAANRAASSLDNTRNKRKRR